MVNLAGKFNQFMGTGGLFSRNDISIGTGANSGGGGVFAGRTMNILAGSA
jgi:hypothetical protein